ncbi:hypothetical protein QBC35DRAFT_535656 [Podospora australis]|uniref:Transmembrane protein n=1 Tax=Podospora australis TaxID=1536484 RepID=A0AAN7ADU4_9PEZI|nr:hypothetical protein QBC35DRAFT_535656 [Podospora australis]
MARSPTPREMRRMASDHAFVFGAHPTPKRLGLWPFVATHLSLPAALFAGIVCVVVAVVYTSVTSRQVLLECPLWANNCHSADRWTVENLGTIQGIITLIYLIGIVSLGYVALAFCEAAVWPLLHIQQFAVRGLNAYLLTARGSIISVPRAIKSVRSLAAGGILFAALAVVLLPLAAPPLVGYAYTPIWHDTQLESNYTSGGGISELYAQANPPTSVIVRVLAKYDSWATDPSSEPLPVLRDWYIDRDVLGERGDFSAKGVSLDTLISCSPHQLQQIAKNNLWWNGFNTNMSRGANLTQSGKNSSSEVWFRPQPQLTLWANDFDFVSERRTRATLIFAALNGTIEGSHRSPLVLANLTSASAIACTVEVEAIDDTLTVGADTPVVSDPPVLSSLEKLTYNPMTPRSARLNELLLWFAVAPVMVGSSVDGAQPMFFNSTNTNRAVAYTASSFPAASQNNWTIPGIEEFIHLSIGALAQATSSSTEHPEVSPVVITSHVPTKKLSAYRALLLIILPVISAAIIIILAAWNVYTHRHLSIPVMRLADIGEILKSSQTNWLRDQAGTDAVKTYLPNELGQVEVKYGVDKEGIVGFARAVGGFGRGGGDGSGSSRSSGRYDRAAV